jgi:hypothetical protein
VSTKTWRFAVLVAGLLTAASAGYQPSARAQGAVAFEPGIGVLPSGSVLDVTPVVSADRRYVRLSVNPYFNNVLGIQNFSFGGGAVAGGAFGGMNGAVGQGGVGGSGMTMTAALGQPLAGSYPPPGLLESLRSSSSADRSTLEGTQPVRSSLDQPAVATSETTAPAALTTTNQRAGADAGVKSSTRARQTPRKTVRKSKPARRVRYSIRDFDFDSFDESF